MTNAACFHHIHSVHRVYHHSCHSHLVPSCQPDVPPHSRTSYFSAAFERHAIMIFEVLHRVEDESACNQQILGSRIQRALHVHAAVYWGAVKCQAEINRCTLSPVMPALIRLNVMHCRCSSRRAAHTLRLDRGTALILAVQETATMPIGSKIRATRLYLRRHLPGLHMSRLFKVRQSWTSRSNVTDLY